MKVSNELLSWVFGDDTIKFHKVDSGIFCDKTTLIYFTSGIDTKNTIDIHAFIHLAKIKAFECGYEVTQNAKDTDVLYRYHKKDKLDTIRTFTRYKLAKKSFKIENIIEALEWVAQSVE